MDGSIVSDFHNQYSSLLMEYYRLRWRLHCLNKGREITYRNQCKEGKQLIKQLDKLAIQLGDVR